MRNARKIYQHVTVSTLWRQVSYKAGHRHSTVRKTVPFPETCCPHSVTHNEGKIYRQIPNIRRTKFQNLNVFSRVLQLALPNPLKPGVKLRMNMKLEQRRQAMLQLHLSDQQVYCLLSCVLYYRFDDTLDFCEMLPLTSWRPWVNFLITHILSSRWYYMQLAVCGGNSESFTKWLYFFSRNGYIFPSNVDVETAIVDFVMRLLIYVLSQFVVRTYNYFTYWSMMRVSYSLNIWGHNRDESTST